MYRLGVLRKISIRAHCLSKVFIYWTSSVVRKRKLANIYYDVPRAYRCVLLFNVSLSRSVGSFTWFYIEDVYRTEYW